MAKITSRGSNNIPTQNSISSIVQSKLAVENIVDILDVVMNSTKKNSLLTSQESVKKLDVFKNVVDKMMGKNGLLLTMITSMKGLSPHTKGLKEATTSIREMVQVFEGKNFKKIDKNITNFKNTLEKLIDVTGYIASKKIDDKSLERALINMKDINDFYKSVDTTLTTIMKMRVPILVSIKLFFIKLVMLNIISLCVTISTMSMFTPVVIMGTLFLTTLSSFLTMMATVFKLIKSIKVSPFMAIKLTLVNMILPILLPMVTTTILVGVAAAAANLVMTPIITYLGQVFGVFKMIRKTPVSPFMFIKLKLMHAILGQTITIIAGGLAIGTALLYLEKMFGSSITPFVQVTIIFVVIQKLFDVIRKTKVGLFTSLKLRMINKALGKVSTTLFKISLLVVDPLAFVKINTITLIFKLMKNMFINILILAPLAIIAIPAMIALSLALVALKLVLKIFIWAIKGIVTPQLEMSLLGLILIVGTLTVMAVMFFAMSLLAVKILESIGHIILLILAITTITVLLGVVGAIVFALQPIFWTAIGGLGLMLVMTTILLAIAAELKLIQNLELDRDAILNSVHTIIDTTKEIVNSIFGGNGGEKKKGENGFMSFLKGMGGTIAMFAGIIITVPFLVSALSSIQLLLILAKRLKKIQQQELDSSAITTNVQTCIDTAMLVVTSINADRSDIKSARKGKRLLRQVKGSVRSLANIAKSLESIQKLKIDDAAIKASVTHIFEVISEIDTMLEQFSNKEAIDPNNKPIKVLSWKERRQRNVAAASGKRLLTQIDRVVGKINDIGGGLMSIAEFKLDQDTKDAITNNITSIFDFITVLDGQIKANILNGAVNSEDIIDTSWTARREWKKKQKMLSKIEATVATLQNIGETINMLKEYKFDAKTEETIKGNIGVMMSSVNTVVNMVLGKLETAEYDDSSLERMGNVIGHIRSLNEEIKNMSSVDTTSLEKNIDSYIRFVDKVNTAEIEKIKTTADMFRQLSRFSESVKGDFDKLAASINENLMPILEELKAAMEGMDKTLEKGFADTSASIGAAGTTANATEMGAQVSRENPKANQSEVEAMVRERLKKQDRDRAQGVATKLDELIRLLKGHTGTVKVKTTW